MNPRVSLRVLIVPDKFKGTMTSLEAARAIASGWRRIRPADSLEILPMSDGGDGFGEMMGHSMGARVVRLRTMDAAHRPCVARWWWQQETDTAVIEAARINGLAMLPKGKYHPFELDTFGLGQALMAAAAKGAKHCLVGIGGSATNDAGFGMARALGWRFLDRQGHDIERWTELVHLKTVHLPETGKLAMRVTVAVDVQNPLLGSEGCSRIYGPQKGLRTEDFRLAERALKRLSEIVPEGKRFANHPGAGAAGGLGFGLMAFAGARLQPGFDMFSANVRLKEHLKHADLIITGEGAIDRSSLMGKGVGELARLCMRMKGPCLGLAGVIPDVDAARQRFAWVGSIVPGLADATKAQSRPRPYLAKLASMAAREVAAVTRKV